MQDFRKLDVWARAHKLTLQVYKTTASFPREELFGLTSQLRRSSASVPANIAEGCGREGNAELTRFCQIAMGSASELEYHLILANDLGFIGEETCTWLSGETIGVKRMLASLIVKIRPDRRPRAAGANGART